jgi:parallel beta-helix repeat protein
MEVALRGIFVGVFASAMAGLLALGAGEASASHVSCGDTITADTTLDSDLDCGELSGGDPPALTIGADGVTLDLNGHMISTLCTSECAGTVVVDDSGGYDRVRILNGRIRPNGVGAAVALVGANRSVLRGLSFDETEFLDPRAGIVLSGSNRNTLASITSRNLNPGILLTDSDGNKIARSELRGEPAALTSGSGVELADGSDRNRIVDSVASGESTGLRIENSVGNRATRSRLAGDAGIVAFVADRTVIANNTLRGGFGVPALLVTADNSLIRRNTANGIWISGDGNRVKRNDVPPPFDFGIFVSAGDANVVRRNTVTGGQVDNIRVEPAATHTLIRGNVVTGANDDGIDIDAAGTIVRGNTATDNGDLGIEAVAGVIDRGGNRASGNGNPLQCVNVVCR